MLIAIDGPAASGKGTVAKKIAEHYELDHLDTGAIYRAVGWKILQSGGDPENKDESVKIAKTITLEDTKNPDLYCEGVGNIASIIASIAEVRSVLLKFQKEFAKNKKGAVLDGRDIGTVICPEADFKFFITANVEARADRRFKQLQNDGKSVIYDSILEDLIRRDERDSNRNVAPLIQAEDAIYIDTTNISASEVLHEAIKYIDSN